MGSNTVKLRIFLGLCQKVIDRGVVALGELTSTYLQN